MLTAIEPNVRAAALNVGGGPIVDIARWSQSYRDITADFWAARVPPLLPPGVPFNDNYVLRNRPVKINDVPGAIDIQNYMELLEWMQAPGDPIPYAPHLRSSTLPDVPIKPVLWQIAKGDMTVPNPTSSSLIRGANMRESTWMYRHDLARAAESSLPANPHVYLALFVSLANGSPTLPSLRAVTIGLDAQQQISGFLKSDGASIPNGNGLSRLLFGRDLFEVPAALPEDLNF
jgi:hypothetical protein